ncbi:MAG: hypothetical protein HGB17_14700 [Syntrophobacteraceae bacterium]|nr:hypothetical protein [Syntrophobacteraceae bacterium]
MQWSKLMFSSLIMPCPAFLDDRRGREVPCRYGDASPGTLLQRVVVGEEGPRAVQVLEYPALGVEGPERSVGFDPVLEEGVAAGVEKLRRVPQVVPVVVMDPQAEHRLPYPVEFAHHAAAEKTPGRQHVTASLQRGVAAVFRVEGVDPPVPGVPRRHLVPRDENPAESGKPVVFKRGMASTIEEAVKVACGIGYPIMIRPSFVLGGRGMEVIYDESMQISKEYENNINWTIKLKESIQEDRIVPFFQPIINIKTLKVEEYECLVRMIDRDGAIVQMVPFNHKAWHAGASRWGKIEGLNSHSIGIELVNWGQLTWAAYRWKSWTGKVLQESEVKEEFIKGIKTGWQTYPDEQIKAAEEACMAISPAYPIKDILGHSDIAPGRKVDPGPAFPMTAFRAKVMDGKHEQQGV